MGFTEFMDNKSHRRAGATLDFLLSLKATTFPFYKINHSVLSH
jgi:hypothetical protein